MNTLFDIETLLPALQSNTLILTPNRRLAAKILASFNQQCQSSRTWNTPRVYSIEAWISRCWEELQDQNPCWVPPQILDGRQELLLWEQVIAADQESSPLLKPSGAAIHAQSAYKTLTLWQQSVDSDLYLQHQGDGNLFSNWLCAFQRRCTELEALTQTQLAAEVISQLTKATLDNIDTLFEKKVVLVSFQDIPPLHKQLLGRLSTDIQDYFPNARNQSKTRIAVSEQQQEIQLAGQWARQVLLQVPGASVGIIVPELQQLRGDIDRQFRQLFDTEYMNPEQWAAEPPYNISIGIPLLEAPVIACANDLLRFRQQSVELSRLPDLLYNPFIPAPDDELDARVELEYRLRRTGKMDFRIAEILKHAKQIRVQSEGPQQASLFDDQENIDKLYGCPALVATLDSMVGTKYPDRNRPSLWCRWFADYLHRLGWPGLRIPISLEYQQIDQFYQLLKDLGRFDTLLGDIDLSEFTRLLQKESQARVFQAKTDESALQILGPLEAAGLNFTHLWVMGLSDDRWPAPASPNPLLPIGLQRILQMPHATPERELQYAAELTRSFIDNSEIIIFSNPIRRDDQQLRPSALITEVTEVVSTELPLSTSQQFIPDRQLKPASQRLPETMLVELSTNQAPQVKPEEIEYIRGGSSIIKNQALCPFQAFIVHRLGARPLETSSLGISASDRGNALHFALELFWTNISNLQNLKSLSENSLKEKINDCSERAISRLKSKSQDWMGSNFWQLEQQRLANLLNQWLKIESERPNFSVLATEQTLNTQLASLPLKLRIDRIDQLEDNSLLLVDYKTGSSHVNAWSGERPREPQLPLYAISTRKNVSAVSFAEVNASTQIFKGFSQYQISISGIQSIAGNKQQLPTEWSDLLEYWRTNLLTLVEQFLRGESAVDPLDANAYRYSGTEPLNRIYEFEHLATSAKSEGVEGND